METGIQYDVACAPCPEYTPDGCRTALQSVLAPLGALDWVQPGMTVGIKVNLVSCLKPEAAATTHPQLLIALSRLLLDKGAKVIVGDSPGGFYTEAYVNHVYRGTGMLLVEAAGAALNHDFFQTTAHFCDAVAAKEFQYTAWLDHCDGIIDFCKLKSHGMMGMSAGAKNMFGIIPGTQKPEYHFRFSEPAAFADMIVDLCEFVKPRLTICDAVVGMEGNGPTQGTPRAIGCVLAAASPHKLDLACGQLIGLTRGDVPTLQAAYLRNLIPDTADKLNIWGNLQDFVLSDFKTVPVPASLLFRNTFRGKAGAAFGAAIAACLQAKPAVHPDECTGCGQCARICPAQAIELQNALPHIHRKQCIRCFCCQEFCPQGAMQVHRTAIARLLDR